MNRFRRWAVVAAALWLTGLAGCGFARSHYLQNGLGKVTEREVRQELGEPDEIVTKDGGQTVWMYEDCLPPRGCDIWYLTFDRDRILRAWERAPEHL